MSMTRQATSTPAIVRVLGLDPGTRVVGWAVIDAAPTRLSLVAAGAILARNPDYPARLAEILRALREIVALHRPAQAAVEEAFSGRNPRTALVIGEGRGVALAALGEAGLPVAAYPARVIKRCVAGNGAADKTQVARMVALQLGLAKPPTPADATDACAVAITHWVRSRAPSGLSAR